MITNFNIQYVLSFPIPREVLIAITPQRHHFWPYAPLGIDAPDITKQKNKKKKKYMINIIL